MIFRLFICLYIFSGVLWAQSLSDRHIPNPQAQELNAAKSSNSVYSRSIYFKLPLEQPKFHWKFYDKQQFLKNKLTLSFRTIDGEQNLVCFEKGKYTGLFRNIHRGKDEDGLVYFGFTSTKEYRVSEIDRVHLTFEVYEDLKGVGAEFKGILKKGIYRSSTQFKLYHLEKSTGKKDVYAFLNNSDWETFWELDITDDKGWMEKKYNKKKRSELPLSKNDYIISLSVHTAERASVFIYDLKNKKLFIESFNKYKDFLAFVTKINKKVSGIVECSFNEDIEDKKAFSFCESLKKIIPEAALSYSINGKQYGPERENYDHYDFPLKK